MMQSKMQNTFTEEELNEARRVLAEQDRSPHEPVLATAVIASQQFVRRNPDGSVVYHSPLLAAIDHLRHVERDACDA